MADENYSADDSGEVVSVVNSDDGLNANPNILGLPVQVIVSVGSAKLAVKDLIEISPDCIVDLNSNIDDPVELFVDNRLIARGELVEASDGGGQIGVRITHLIG